MENKVYIISEECKDRKFECNAHNKIFGIVVLAMDILDSIAMSTQHEELTEMYKSGVMKKTITLENATETMRGVDTKCSKAANILGFLVDKTSKDIMKESCKLINKNVIMNPDLDNMEISEETYKKIRQSLGFYKQSEIDELQQNDNK